MRDQLPVLLSRRQVRADARHKTVHDLAADAENIVFQVLSSKRIVDVIHRLRVGHDRSNSLDKCLLPRIRLLIRQLDILKRLGKDLLDHRIYIREIVVERIVVDAKIIADFPDADFSKGLFTNIVRSDAGRIRSLDIGGVLVKGTQLRSAFSLKSTNVQISEENGNVIFRVKGNGHGVGMSQYGAEAMARNGSNYREILQHYYAQTDVTMGK